jgi:hypothetical protein
MNSVETFTGLSEANILGMYDVFTEMIEGYLFQGPTGTFAVTDLILGFYSEMSLRVANYTEESFLEGNAIYYNPWVTPILTNQFGPARW